MKNQERTFSIGDAEQLTGVSKRMLRSWDGKHIPVPERIVWGGRAYRRYTGDQVDLIRQIKEYRDQGYTPKMAVNKARKVLEGKPDSQIL